MANIKTEKLNLRIDPDLKQKLLKVAESERRTLTNYILYIAEKDADKKISEKYSRKKVEMR